MYCGKGMELGPNACADCCTDCASAAPACCCTAAVCCDVNCQLLRPPDPNSYVYNEPEENFVSIDDVKIKSLLLKIGQQQLQERQLLQQKKLLQQQQQQQQQIIELLDDDEAIVEQQQEPPALAISAPRSLKQNKKRKSLEIQPVALELEQPQRIVARIELSDSECEDAQAEKEEEEQNVATVSCELQHAQPAQIIVLQSDDEEQPQLQQLQLQQKPTTKRKATNKKRATRPYRKRSGSHYYQCQACGKKVQSNYNLRRHMMIHTGERPFPCDLCDRRFREFSDLKKHRRRHMGDPRYTCMICHQNSPADFIRCTKCEGKNLVFEEQSEDDLELRPDLELNDDDEYQEVEQQDEFQMEEPVQTAAKAIESERPTLMVTLVPPAATALATAPASTSAPATLLRPPLPRSGSSANSSSSLSNDVTSSRHASRTRSTYPCPLCQRVFGTRHNLKRHYMIHTGEKPFSCSKCRKPFRECSTLKKHMVTHARERWYKCDHCAAKYQDYLHYTEHRAAHLPKQSGDSPSKHRRRSSDTDDGDSSVEDWLECCECQVRFTELDAYTDHLKQHDLELYGLAVDDLDIEEPDVDVA